MKEWLFHCSAARNEKRSNSFKFTVTKASFWGVLFQDTSLWSFYFSKLLFVSPCCFLPKTGRRHWKDNSDSNCPATLSLAIVKNNCLDKCETDIHSNCFAFTSDGFPSDLHLAKSHFRARTNLRRWLDKSFVIALKWTVFVFCLFVFLLFFFLLVNFQFRQVTAETSHWWTLNVGQRPAASCNAQQCLTKRFGQNIRETPQVLLFSPYKCDAVASALISLATAEPPATSCISSSPFVLFCTAAACSQLYQI